MEVQARNAFEMLCLQLANRKAKPRSGRAGIIFRNFALGMFGVNAKADIDAVIQERRKTTMLMRAVENDMVRNVDDLGHVSLFITSTIGRDFALIIIPRETRFPKARTAYAIQIFADDRCDLPHGKSLHRAQYLSTRTQFDVRQNGKIPPQRNLIHHKGGRGYAVKVKMRKCAGIACLGFHVIIHRCIKPPTSC